MSKINFEEDVANIDQTGLESVAELLRKQLQMEAEIETEEAALKDLKEKHRKLSEQVIPERMAELGMTSTTMADGSRVDIVENIYVSIPKDAEKSKACYDWLEDNGLGDIIKNQVSTSFGTGEDNMAGDLAGYIESNFGITPDVKKSVHPSTLKATLKKRHEEGLTDPDDLFGIFIRPETKITKGKK